MKVRERVQGVAGVFFVGTVGKLKPVRSVLNEVFNKEQNMKVKLEVVPLTQTQPTAMN